MTVLATGLSQAEEVKKPEVPVTGTAVPGGDGTFTILWNLRPSQGWHIYADRLNDSGFPPGLTVAWPEDWTAGELLWPRPERYVMDGGILDHVYHDSLTLVQEVRLAEDALDSGPVALQARWDWLACKDMCVPGHSSAELVFLPDQDDEDARVLLTEARSFLPHPWPSEDVEIRWTEDAVILRVSGAASLEFHPAADGARPVDLIDDGAVDGDTLTLRLRPRSGAFGPVRGDLHAKYSDGRQESWTVDTPFGG